MAHFQPSTRGSQIPRLLNASLRSLNVDAALIFPSGKGGGWSGSMPIVSLRKSVCLPRCPSANHVSRRQKRPRHLSQHAQTAREKRVESATRRAGGSRREGGWLPSGSTISRVTDSIDAPTTRAAHSDAGHGRVTDPTWLEHTLEIKDDHNKGSQTGGENHPANAAHPHQVTKSLFHGRCSLAWGRAALLDSPGLWRYRGGFVCRSMRPTHPQRSVPLRHLGVGRRPRHTPPLLEQMSASIWTAVSESIGAQKRRKDLGNIHGRLDVIFLSGVFWSEAAIYVT